MKQLKMILGLPVIFAGFLVAMDSPTVQKKLNESAASSLAVSPKNNPIFYGVISAVFNHQQIGAPLLGELKKIKKEISTDYEGKKDGTKRLSDKVCLHAFAESEKERIDLLEEQEQNNRVRAQGTAFLKTLVGFGLFACACKGFYDLGVSIVPAHNPRIKDGQAALGLGTMLYGGAKLMQHNFHKGFFFNSYWADKKKIAEFNATQLKSYVDEKLN